jgi:hypothetical protein
MYCLQKKYDFNIFVNLPFILHMYLCTYAQKRCDKKCKQNALTHHRTVGVCELYNSERIIF